MIAILTGLTDGAGWIAAGAATADAPPPPHGAAGRGPLVRAGRPPMTNVPRIAEPSPDRTLAASSVSGGASAAAHHDLVASRARSSGRRSTRDRTLEAMRSGAGGDRIADDVASALASGVTSAPPMFIAGERYRGELRRAPISRRSNAP